MLPWITASDDRRHFRRLWAAMLVLLVSLTAVSAYVGDPQLRSSWRGIAIGLLLILYLSWLLGGMFHRLPKRERAWGFRLASWLIAVSIADVLALANHNFVLLLWITFGSTPFYLGTRASLVPMIGVLALIGLIQVGSLKLPHGSSAWASLASGLLGVAVWVLLIVAIERLVRQRAENERLIAELKTSQEQLRQAAAKERELLVHRERARLARDLHDIIGHALVLASVKLEAAQRLDRVDRERAAAELTATQQLLRQTMTELRQAVTNLRTEPESEDTPAALLDQIKMLVDETGIRATLMLAPVNGLSPLQADALRRIAQEALTNIVKHAGASEISVSLHCQQDEAVLEIADNGRGFGRTDSEPTGHYGVRGMRERIELAGGELTVRSVPGSGTTVRATLPLVPGDGQAPVEAAEVTVDVA